MRSSIVLRQHVCANALTPARMPVQHYCAAKTQLCQLFAYTVGNFIVAKPTGKPAHQHGPAPSPAGITQGA